MEEGEVIRNSWEERGEMDTYTNWGVDGKGGKLAKPG